MRDLRLKALKALSAIARGAPAQAALAASGLTGNERQICSDLVYGVLRTRLRLKKRLGEVLPALEKLPAKMVIILEMALYSHLFQNRARMPLVINDTVALVKSLFGQKMANVANGALRRLLRAKDESAPPASLAECALYYGIPPEIARLWTNAYGEKAARKLMGRSFQRPYGAARVHPAFPELYEALAQNPGAVPVGPNGIAYPPGKLPERILEKSLNEWHELGAFSFQAAGSQEVLEALDIYQAWQGADIWDVCAGAGGKTCALLERKLRVTLASDLNFSRLLHLKRECARLHLRAPAIFQMDLGAPACAAWEGHILADIPCSGLGVLARRPDIRDRWSEERLKQLQSLQLTLIHSLARLTGVGAEVCLVTCTLNPAENERLVIEMEKLGFELLRQWETPHKHPWLEGMFGARLVKTNV